MLCGEMGTDNNQHGGLFPHLIGTAAFFHKATFGVEAVRRHHPGSTVIVERSRPIGGEGRAYARVVHGTFLPTGNPFELRYGANRIFPNLPSFSLRFRSVACPVTVFEVTSVANDVLRGGFSVRPSYLEMTFDMPNVTVADLRNHLLTAARYERELEDEKGARTFYAGSPRSPFQIRIYDDRGPVRLEPVFRSTYLRAHGILSLGDVAKMRGLDLSKTLRFVERKPGSPLAADLSGLRDSAQKRLLMHWPNSRPLKLWVSALRFHGVDPERHLVESPWQQRTEEMLRRLIW